MSEPDLGESILELIQSDKFNWMSVLEVIGTLEQVKIALLSSESDR